MSFNVPDHEGYEYMFGANDLGVLSFLLVFPTFVCLSFVRLSGRDALATSANEMTFPLFRPSGDDVQPSRSGCTCSLSLGTLSRFR